MNGNRLSCFWTLAAFAALMPSGIGDAQAADQATDAATPRRVGFSARASLETPASADRLAEVFQDPVRWIPHIVGRTHIDGPERGLGAVYLTETLVQGTRMRRREETIIFEARRILIRAESEAPTVGTTFIDFELLPASSGTRMQLTIYVDIERAAFGPATDAQIAALLPQIVQGNQAVLADELRRLADFALGAGGPAASSAQVRRRGRPAWGRSEASEGPSGNGAPPRSR